MKVCTSDRLVFVLVTFAALAFMGSAAAQRAGQSMTVQTGLVVAAQAVNLQSRATAGGAAVGGILGYAVTSSGQSSSRRARNTILGAATGGVIANRAQGDLNGMEYTVRIANGTRIQVVTDQSGIKVGDCVNVEQAGSGTANVRRVSSALCDAAASNSVDADIRTGLTQAADMCLAAKERLLDAETDAEIQAAIRRVQILCDD
jgi:type II secretory pathway pseudopilin PulG